VAAYIHKYHLYLPNTSSEFNDELDWYRSGFKKDANPQTF
jgi:hypothetical protein